MTTAESLIQHLNLEPHPEGGFYKEKYRSGITIAAGSLPVGFCEERSLSTSIYFLLRSGDISKFHRLRSDEIWYHHQGSSVRLILIDSEGVKHTKILGTHIERAEHPQVIIPAGTIFGAEVHGENSYALMSCVVSPGFDFRDFEMFDKEDLLQAYPKHTEVIEKFG